MSTVHSSPDAGLSPRVKAVFDDIRATRGSDFINHFWRYLAFDPPLLESTWAEVKRVMATPSALDPLTKELLYIAVSVANGCGYCVHSHTAAGPPKARRPPNTPACWAGWGLRARPNHRWPR